MAKVKAPLFSLDARGQIGKTLVFMAWKGINDVRKYVIPANPNTAAQQTQRGYFSDAVDTWHNVAWTDDDKTAWDLLATTLGSVMSGFNAFVKHYIAVVSGDFEWKSVYNYQATPASDTCDISFDTDMTMENGALLKYGTSKSSLIQSAVSVVSSGVMTFSLTGLNSSTKYFCKVVPNDTSERAYSGIYTFETTA